MWNNNGRLALRTQVLYEASFNKIKQILYSSQSLITLVHEPRNYISTSDCHHGLNSRVIDIGNDNVYFSNEKMFYLTCISFSLPLSNLFLSPETGGSMFIWHTHAHSYVGVNKMQHRILVVENLNRKMVNFFIVLNLAPWQASWCSRWDIHIAHECLAWTWMDLSGELPALAYLHLGEVPSVPVGSWVGVRDLEKKVSCPLSLIEPRFLSSLAHSQPQSNHSVLTSPNTDRHVLFCP